MLNSNEMGDFAQFSQDRREPWEKMTGVAAVLRKWLGTGRISHNLVFDHRVGAVEGQSLPFPSYLSATIQKALEAKEIPSLYSHQAQAIECAMKGEHLVIATPTASGKSLCYNLPVLQALSEAPSTRALYLFPTKALSRDQEENLRGLMQDCGIHAGAVTYDGDTPADARRAARNRGGVVLTNPDMLHTGILPHHASWARLFSELKYVVVDELHIYRGVFGSHLANVLRRLKRIANFHGADPTFIFASATIGNPAEHAGQMIGEPVRLVSESGAPTGDKRVLLYNPPVVNAELGIRESCVKAAVRLAADLVRADVSTIVFGQSRNGVEVMLKYLRERLARDKISPEQIHAYRGGYLPGKRREIEKNLREGRIKCVVATNALELGIDIGSLDAVVCAGYPGSIASVWQRFGRAGRRRDLSLALLVTNSSPVDQFFAHFPDALVESGTEHARIDPDNIEIFIQHLKCAAFELPFEVGHTFGDVPPDGLVDGLEYLVENKLLYRSESEDGVTMYHWAADAYPANHVSLRSVSWDNFVIIDLDSEKTIAEMDWRSTHTMLHEQAIYQHMGEQFQVEKLDFDNHKAFVRKVKPDYYTDAMTYVRVAVLDQDEDEVLPTSIGVNAQIGLGEVNLTEKIVGYKKIKYNTHENVGYGDVRLPDMQMHTTSFWLTIPNEMVTQLDAPRPVVVDALRGFAKALHTVSAVGLMTDPKDLGHTVKDPQTGEEALDEGHPLYAPTVFIYDKIPGGVGLAPRIFDEREGLVKGAYLLIQRCTCRHGCPACIGPSIGDDQMSLETQNSGDRKSLSLRIGSWLSNSPSVVIDDVAH